MIEKRYLYAVAGGGFVLGDNIYCTVPPGMYEKVKSTHNVDGSPVDAVGFIHVSREGLDKQPIPVTDYLKNEAGDAYINLAELEGAIVSFFLKASSFAAGGFAVTSIQGDGINTDYILPSNCDIAGDFLITNDSLSAELIVVSDVKKIRFTTIPTVEQATYLLYTKII